VVERRALRLVGLSFLALAAYVLYESVESLIRRQAPDESLPGILLATASLIVMPLLARAKRRVARAIESGALSADARQTELCFYLSAILLGGLLLNSLLGWWWADPAAALAMVPLIAHEGIDAFKGEGCGCAPSH
jgi:divalent metal cation (Fe/Co/Zn/Cd) transporter